jgi:hypothetical protein
VHERYRLLYRPNSRAMAVPVKLPGWHQVSFGGFFFFSLRTHSFPCMMSAIVVGFMPSSVPGGHVSM